MPGILATAVVILSLLRGTEHLREARGRCEPHARKEHRVPRREASARLDAREAGKVLVHLLAVDTPEVRLSPSRGSFPACCSSCADVVFPTKTTSAFQPSGLRMRVQATAESTTMGVHAAQDGRAAFRSRARRADTTAAPKAMRFAWVSKEIDRSQLHCPLGLPS